MSYTHYSFRCVLITEGSPQQMLFPPVLDMFAKSLSVQLFQEFTDFLKKCNYIFVICFSSFIVLRSETGS